MKKDGFDLVLYLLKKIKIKKKNIKIWFQKLYPRKEKKL